jgi:DNA topoisomerase-1
MAVMKKLLVVESHQSANNWEYLGKDFEVVATVGHLRDLPGNKMGVDLVHDFEIDYQIDSQKRKLLTT